MTKIKLKPLGKKVHQMDKMTGKNVYTDPMMKYYDAQDAAERAMKLEPKPTVANGGRVIRRKRK